MVSVRRHVKLRWVAGIGATVPAASVGAVAAVPTPTTGAPSALWSADMESGVYGDYFVAGATWNWQAPSSAPVMTTEQAFAGTRSCKFTIPGGGVRCEGLPKPGTGFDGAFHPGDDLWFSTCVRTLSVTNTSNFQLVQQWQNDEDTSPPLQVNIASGVWQVSGGFRTGSWFPTARSMGTHTNDTWEHFVFHILFSPDNTVGTVNAWRNGSQVVTDYKPTGGTMYPGNSGGYYKYGYYRSSAIGTAGSIYHDNLKIGTSAASVGGTG